MKSGLAHKLRRGVGSVVTGLAALCMNSCNSAGGGGGRGGEPPKNANNNFSNDNGNFNGDGTNNITGVIPGYYDGAADCTDFLEYNDGSYEEASYEADIRVTINERGMPERNGVEIERGYSISGGNADGTRLDLVAKYVGSFENLPGLEIYQDNLADVLYSNMPGAAILYDATLSINYNGQQIVIRGEGGEFFLKCDSSCFEESDDSLHYYMFGYGEGSDEAAGLIYQTFCEIPEMNRR